MESGIADSYVCLSPDMVYCYEGLARSTDQGWARVPRGPIPCSFCILRPQTICNLLIMVTDCRITVYLTGLWVFFILT